MIIKCKMCGGDIEFAAGDTYGTCEYCGSTSTIPKVDDEGKLNRYNRANYFRRQCEFDKAVAAYEKILEQDDANAEAHWGAVISRYGIEYVEDPTTKKRIPTCHRVQMTSILADKDYKAAVENAPDPESRKIYEEEAARIAEIQKGILAISQNERPYDVFICYKETDENGQRTHDSQWAQEVYYGLTEQGYKVFFSRITLEDKLGQEYEPYIFAALNSARVMIVIGSKPEYFNAVWVKNEWSRYLALMEQDRKRLLIPCYRGMDPYELPDELSSLQSQDMGKIGFMQDLLRGVKKVLDTGRQSEQPKSVSTATAPVGDPGLSPGISSLMERASLFMEDGDFDSAAEYLNRVLDINPKYAPAYAAKTCVAFHLRKESELAETKFLYNDNLDWQKAIRFADPQQKTVYEGYVAKVKGNIANQIRNYVYDCAIEMAVTPGTDKGRMEAEIADYKAACERSTGKRVDGSRRRNFEQQENVFDHAVKTSEPGDVSESELKVAAKLFESIGDDEGTERAHQCMVLAEQARQKTIYYEADKMLDREQHKAKPDIAEIGAAEKLFLSVPDYKDAIGKVQKCKNLVESFRSALYEKAVNAINEAGDESRRWVYAEETLAVQELTGYRDVEELRAMAARRYDECVTAEREAKRQAEERIRIAVEAENTKKKRITILSISAIVILIALILLVTQVIIPWNGYRKATTLKQEGKYEEAIAAFTALGGYSDSATQIIACQDGIKERGYQAAIALKEEGKYEEAIATFTTIGNYSDSVTQINACREGIRQRIYQAAIALKEEGKYEEAITAFEAMQGYSDSVAQIEACQNSINERSYQAAIALKEEGKYEEAIAGFEKISDYRDSAMQNYYCRISMAERDYQAAVDLQKAGQYEEAITAFESVKGYSDSVAQITESKYLWAKALTAEGNYASAVSIFNSIDGYKDVDSILESDHMLSAAARDAKYAVGNYVTFGRYPQISGGNYSTPIEWQVIVRDGQKALLLSRYGLDTQPYNTTYTSTTWEECTLRKWLNGTFLGRAFTEREQTGILTTIVDNRSHQGFSKWGTSGGNNTLDKVFLLSYAEANKYFGVPFSTDGNTKSRVSPTEYAIKLGAYSVKSSKTNDAAAFGGWWLRSPGSIQNYAACVNYDGTLCGNTVNRDSICVRPAVWIDLESGIF